MFAIFIQYKTLPVYDCVYKQEVPLNPYKYMYTLHREDRAHAKHTGLDINGEVRQNIILIVHVL